jgi:hypothetical protein
MFSALIRIALALEILLVCVDGAVSRSQDYVPLGG